MKNLEVYIHIPFCLKKCDYCDFLSMPAYAEERNAYIQALKKEIWFSDYKFEGYEVDTIFIGGGTPSILETSQLEDILNTLREVALISKNAEITVECNPGTVTREKLTLYKNMGVNRISFGLQSCNDKELKEIGRIHTYQDFIDSYNLARECGFDNINIDLMSALPNQSVESYKDTLEKVLDLQPEHISAYSLIVEEGTPLADRVEECEKNGVNILPNEDDERKMYYMTKELLEAKGYKRYEISNYAKDGYECRHNVGYWKRVEYLGFGIGAASFYNRQRYNNIEDAHLYIKSMNKELSPEDIEVNVEELTSIEEMEEFMFLGLRMTEGISINEFEDKFGKKFDDVYGRVVNILIEKELMLKDGDVVKLTDKGIDVSNRVLSEFLL